ncbi:hypothetical protein HKX48_005874 [Thoreauomyces humboldtii]|nr:hypothetical protein HKX48_005874 [Thoreauomyces humboldtii]
MKFTENQYLFAHPFSTVTTANWRKYPNQKSEHVLSVDTLERRVCPKTGTLHTERLVSVKQQAPALVRRLLPIPEVAFFRETSILDPRGRRYTAVSSNLSMRSIVDVEETCEFSESGDGEGTVFKQRAEVSALGALSYAARLVEEAAVSSFQRNSWKGRVGLEEVVDKILLELEDVEVVMKEGIDATIEGLRQGSVGL